ncbi:unnamed protein product, partial [Trichobilharzia regenti]
NGCGQESLFRVIKAYSIHDPEVGYCQGSAFIVGLLLMQLEQLIADNLPDLYTHFRTQSFAPSLYASAWFLTLFSTILPIPFATRVMDFYIVEVSVSLLLLLFFLYVITVLLKYSLWN